MTSILGLICEATAPLSHTKHRKPIPYCMMDPWVFFEFGFENGPTMERAGSIVMLPSDTDATIYDSIFCILTKDVPHIEGTVIGKVTKGFDTLQYIVWKYGHWTGIPRERLVILNCGQL
ncbi:PPIase cyclophilin-type domain-containing protein [Trichostrongylus colubriformis]|uniref:PPIase cyclophilin-type domain-containing protein n=1 Tax=Trichostrongylus colubriformis TaxID=6319 RepID=A0AAN8IFH0_TRICO